MKTERILQLLTEAATTDDPIRACKIAVALCHETYAFGEEEPGVYSIDTKAAGIETLINSLFFDLWNHNQAMLPAMLPVFVIACGDRDGSIIAHFPQESATLPDNERDYWWECDTEETITIDHASYWIDGVLYFVWDNALWFNYGEWELDLFIRQLHYSRKWCILHPEDVEIAQAVRREYLADNEGE